jgi:TonB family protein|tara:strand:- start:2322 stop:2864 length:543 start_codon:yes stop_codon:yes gene_type:complete
MKLSSLVITATTIALHMAGGLAVTSWLANHAGIPPNLGVQPSVIEYVQLAETLTEVPTPLSLEPLSAPTSVAVKPSVPATPAPPPLSIVKASPIATENKPPQYPRMALRRQQAGTVLLRVHVLANGTPTSVQIHASSGHRLLDQAGIAAVSDWQFSPQTANGQVENSWVNIPITFKLSDS